jgi:hypothetical protein
MQITLLHGPEALRETLVDPIIRLVDDGGASH